MKKLILSLIVCICFVRCKDDVILTTSPTVHLDQFTFGKAFLRGDNIKVFLTDLDGNIIGEFDFNIPSTIQIPEFINKTYDKYHITVSQQHFNDPEQLYFKTYTNLKVNSLERISDELSLNTINYNSKLGLRLMFFYLDINNSLIDFAIFPNSGCHFPSGGIQSSVFPSILGSQSGDNTYLILKLKNESFLRYGKYDISQNNNIDVTVNEMETFSTELISEEHKSGFLGTSVLLYGFDCDANQLVPLNINNTNESANNFLYIQGDELNMKTYLTSYSITTNDFAKNYLIYKKGPILKNYNPVPLDVDIIRQDFDEFYFIFKKTNNIEITRWKWKTSADNKITWEVIGDYRNVYHAPKKTPSFLPELNLDLAKLNLISSIQSSEYKDYEAYMKFTQTLNLPFYLTDFCESDEPAFYEIKSVDIN